MAEMPTQEVEEEYLPSLASVYQLYEDDKSEEFIDAAEILLDEDFELNRYHTIQLLILLANSVEDPADTREYYNRAQTEYRRARTYHQEEPDGMKQLDQLQIKLERVRNIVEAEAEKEAAAEEAEVMGEELVGGSARGRPDLNFLADGANDAKDTFDRSSGLEGAPDMEETQSLDNLAFRPKQKPSKFMGSLKMKSLKPAKSKSELRSLSTLFQPAEQSEAPKRDDAKSAKEERSMSYE
ncbi:hypothetical protein DOTSEDRAFT_73859 [Dothistroma septosporum NZE10]|uniref:Uncharacterized protein n=1 Tax=Dothistroma septosporum (strain NZE10 / CBS 128990) TaxID=675120 RepID=N1PGR1_DOTSN|nr:hypothetical protein DOTSEDRAFT_73859 [Dothistroma septosporum NZE10]